MTEPDGTHTGVDLWSSESWRLEAQGWLDDRLGLAGIERTGELESVRVMPWATVLRAPTNRGDVWIKAAGELTAFEVAIYPLLYAAAPDHVIEPIAVDAGRGWIVLPHAGLPVGEQQTGEELFLSMSTALRHYGGLQRKLAPQVDELLALGMTDMRPAAMPARFDEAAAAVEPYVRQRGNKDELRKFESAVALKETFNSWCRRLETTPGQPSIDHNDLHFWNVLVSEDEQKSLRIYDWGDSVIAHPFASLLVTLSFFESQRGHQAGSPELLQLRDGYLSAFNDLAPHAELVETMELACRVGKVARTLTWHRALSEFAGTKAFEDWTSAPFDCFVSVLEESYHGSS